MNTRKKITKLSCLLIALIMVASVATGCTKKNTVAATSSEIASSSASLDLNPVSSEESASSLNTDVSSAVSSSATSSAVKKATTSTASKAYASPTKPSTGTNSTATTTTKPSTTTTTKPSTTTTTPAPAPAPAPAPTATLNMPTSSQLATINEYLVGMVNSIRSSSVSERSGLMQAADIRSSECLSCYSHTRPNGTPYSTVFTQIQYGTPYEDISVVNGQEVHTTKYNYGVSGEILGGADWLQSEGNFTGTSSQLHTVAQRIFNAWKNSSGHYAIMVGSSYHCVGFGTKARIITADDGRKALDFISIGDFTQK